MSNTQVGTIYQQIIADVIESSRVDFEEGGVDESVLEALRQGWQNKLSQLEVASFPWDPKPEPVPNSSSSSSNGGNFQHMGNQSLSQQPLQQIGTGNSGSNIKTEPGLEGSSMLHYGGQISTLPPTTTTAQQRAAAHLHNNYGPRAAASINAIQQGGPAIHQFSMMQMMQQQQQPQQQQPHIQPSVAQTLTQNQTQKNQPIIQQEYQYNQLFSAQSATEQQPIPQNNAQGDVSSAQSDGTGESNQIKILSRISDNFYRDFKSMDRTEIDGIIRLKVEAMASAMEGGGLMLPLRPVTTSTPKFRRIKRSVSEKARTQMDGIDDDDDDVKDDDLDEDAINSDLDDPDDGLNEDEEEEDGMGHIMLCMYDKVQRVKNKWKCVMKDGVLTVNNREYVFHKASDMGVIKCTHNYRKSW